MMVWWLLFLGNSSFYNVVFGSFLFLNYIWIVLLWQNIIIVPVMHWYVKRALKYRGLQPLQPQYSCYFNKMSYSYGSFLGSARWFLSEISQVILVAARVVIPWTYLVIVLRRSKPLWRWNSWDVLDLCVYLFTICSSILETLGVVQISIASRGIDERERERDRICCIL